MSVGVFVGSGLVCDLESEWCRFHFEPTPNIILFNQLNELGDGGGGLRNEGQDRLGQKGEWEDTVKGTK